MFSGFLPKAGAALVILLVLWLSLRFLLPVAMPFLLAAVLALAAEPLVKTFQARLHLPRGAAAGIGVFIALCVTVLLILTICAFLLRELGQLAGIIPDLEDTASDGIHALQSFCTDLAMRTPESIRPVLMGSVDGFFSDGSRLLDQVSAKLLSLASGVLKTIPDSALGLGTWIISSFMISAKLPQIKAFLQKRTPEAWHRQLLPAARQMKHAVAGWLLAQLKLTLITFGVLCIGFLVLQIRYAPLWAALISLLDALPILGTGTVLVPWSLVCLLQGDHIRAIGLLGIYAAAALLRSVLEPRFVGKQLGLDPLVTLMALYAGYHLWGFPGMILAPLVAVTAAQVAAGSRQP